MIHVKGSAVTSRIRFVRERFGETGLRDLKEALAPAERTEIEGRILPSQWVSYDLFIDLIVKADTMFGQGDLSLAREMAHFSADVNLKTLYRIFFQIGTPTFILKRASRLWQMHYDSGHLEIADEQEGQVKLRIRDFARPHPAHCTSVLGWAERSAELSGGVVEQAEETRCRTGGDDVCELTVHWRE